MAFQSPQQVFSRGSPLASFATGAPTPDAILCEKYRRLAKYHLRRLPALFTKFTGLFSHLVWAPTWPARWITHGLPSRSQLCRGIVDGRPEFLPKCHGCATRHLGLALKSSHKGHRFTCPMGVHNFWLPVIVRGCLVGLAFVQALASPLTGTAARPAPARVQRAAAGAAGTFGGRHSPRKTRRLSPTEFGQAAKLLQLVFQHVETSALADLRKSDLSRAQQALLELQTVATRLRTELNGLVPAFNKTAPVLELENHTDQLVHAALEYMHRHYAQPLTLRQYASRVRLNPAYLSAQFSRAVGTPFKTYLTEMRMERARELLSDPTRCIAEVAYAVGYASENRFRLAFRQMNGLSPSRWRETLRMDSPKAE